MQNELPEWAMETADMVWTALANNEANGREAETTLFARALVAAERRGIERSAKVAETGYWSSALGSATGSAIATAIRQLVGEG